MFHDGCYTHVFWPHLMGEKKIGQQYWQWWKLVTVLLNWIINNKNSMTFGWKKKFFFCFCSKQQKHYQLKWMNQSFMRYRYIQCGSGIPLSISIFQTKNKEKKTLKWWIIFDDQFFFLFCCFKNFFFFFAYLSFISARWMNNFTHSCPFTYSFQLWRLKFFFFFLFSTFIVYRSNRSNRSIDDYS